MVNIVAAIVPFQSNWMQANSSSAAALNEVSEPHESEFQRRAVAQR